MNNNILDQIMSADQAAKQLGISKFQLTRRANLLVNRGQPTGRLIDGLGWVFLPSDLELLGQDLRRKNPG